jgi:hypothetical protein
MVSFVRLGPTSTPNEMALTSQLSEVVKVAAIEKVNDVVDFIDWIVDSLSQHCAIVLFVLWVWAVSWRNLFTEGDKWTSWGGTFANWSLKRAVARWSLSLLGFAPKAGRRNRTS